MPLFLSLRLCLKYGSTEQANKPASPFPPRIKWLLPCWWPPHIQQTVQTVTCATVRAFFVLPCCWPSYIQHQQLGRCKQLPWQLLVTILHWTLSLLGWRDYSYLGNRWCLFRLLCQFVGSIHNQRCDIQAAFKLQNKHPTTFITTTHCQQDKLTACTHTRWYLGTSLWDCSNALLFLQSYAGVKV